VRFSLVTFANEIRVCRYARNYVTNVKLGQLNRERLYLEATGYYGSYRQLFW